MKVVWNDLWVIHEVNALLPGLSRGSLAGERVGALSPSLLRGWVERPCCG